MFNTVKGYVEKALTAPYALGGVGSCFVGVGEVTAVAKGSAAFRKLAEGAKVFQVAEKSGKIVGKLEEVAAFMNKLPGSMKNVVEKIKNFHILNGEGVEFIDGRPNFTPWSKDSIKFKKGMLDGSKNDFNLVYEKIMQLKGFKSKNEAKAWLKEKGLTPHHKSFTEIELIPTDLHANIPHIGSASDLRGGK
nr:HNH endonuclease [Bacillus toyonensis]